MWQRHVKSHHRIQLVAARAGIPPDTPLLYVTTTRQITQHRIQLAGRHYSGTLALWAGIPPDTPLLYVTTTRQITQHRIQLAGRHQWRLALWAGIPPDTPLLYVTTTRQITQHRIQLAGRHSGGSPYEQEPPRYTTAICDNDTSNHTT